MKSIRKILLPFSLLYDLITTVRNLLYDIGFLRSYAADIPVLVVGNLSMGGTGKTPQIEYLIRLLQKDYKVAVLSRGYKRKTKGFILIRDYHNVEEVGDEPFQFFKKFPKIDVAVDADRVNGIKVLIDNVNPDIILLDDAFQHRRVRRTKNILLTKFDELFTQDDVVPLGHLRENRKGAKRADVVVVTKCPPKLAEVNQQKIKEQVSKYTSAPVFFSSISYADKTKGFKGYTVEDFKKNEIFIVTGIANPKPLLEFLIAINYKIHHLKFPDHHYFSKEDIEKISREYEALPKSSILLTTEKDYMRLEGRMQQLCYLPIETKFIHEEDAFNEIIMSSCSANS